MTNTGSVPPRRLPRRGHRFRIRHPPQIPASHRAVRGPLRGDRQAGLVVQLLALVVQQVQPAPQPGVAQREDVEPAHGEDQEHFGGPAADAGQGVEGFDGGFVVELAQLAEVGGVGVVDLGHGLQPLGLGVGQAAGAQRLRRCADEVRGLEARPGQGGGGHPRLDGVGGPGRQLLADDRAAQHMERIAPRAADAAGAVRLDQAGQLLVAPAQVRFGGTQDFRLDHGTIGAGGCA